MGVRHDTKVRRARRRGPPPPALAGDRAWREQFLRELRVDHSVYSRILSMVSREVSRLPGNPRTTLALLSEAFEFIIAYFDDYHHAREDELYRRLSRQSRGNARLLAKLDLEHRRGAGASGRIYAEIQRLTCGPVPGRLHALGREVDAFVTESRAHIGHEEWLMYSRGLRVLTDADWQVIANQTPKPDSGASIEVDERRYPLLSGDLRAHGIRFVDGSTHGVLEDLRIDTAGAAYGYLIGCGVETVMLAGGQAREAASLALNTARTLLTPRRPSRYAEAARQLVHRNVSSMLRWGGQWRSHLRLRFVVD